VVTALVEGKKKKEGTPTFRFFLPEEEEGTIDQKKEGRKGGEPRFFGPGQQVAGRQKKKRNGEEFTISPEFWMQQGEREKRRTEMACRVLIPYPSKGRGKREREKTCVILFRHRLRK